MKYLHGQILTHSLLALYWGVSVLSGHAARRERSVGIIGERGHRCTPEENTDDGIETMLRQIHIVRECCESLPTGEP